LLHRAGAGRGLLGHALEALARLPAQLRLQRRQVAAHVELSPVLVDHLEIHEHVGRQGLQLEVGGEHARAGVLVDVGDQRVDQVAAAEAHRVLVALEKAGRVIRQRHAVAAQLLRQAFQQQLHLLLQHARHQPVGTLARDLVQREQRHAQGHAVARAARLEVIGQRHLDAGDVHRLREQLGGDAGRLVAHQLFAHQVQPLTMSAGICWS
jgi:hypothetical protein